MVFIRVLTAWYRVPLRSLNQNVTHSKRYTVPRWIIGQMLAWIVVATPSIPRLSLVVKLLDMSFKIGPLGMVPSNLR